MAKPDIYSGYLFRKDTTCTVRIDVSVAVVVVVCMCLHQLLSHLNAVRTLNALSVNVHGFGYAAIA